MHRSVLRGCLGELTINTNDDDNNDCYCSTRLMSGKPDHVPTDELLY